MSGTTCCSNTDYPLSSCPDGGNCTKCGTDRYKFNKCNSGYTPNGTTCCLNSYYNITGSCPTRGSCSTCGNRKHLDSCSEGYEPNSARTSCSAAACDGFTTTNCTGNISNKLECKTCKSGTTTKYQLVCLNGYTSCGGTACCHSRQSCDNGSCQNYVIKNITIFEGRCTDRTYLVNNHACTSSGRLDWASADEDFGAPVSKITILNGLDQEAFAGLKSGETHTPGWYGTPDSRYTFRTTCTFGFPSMSCMNCHSISAPGCGNKTIRVKVEYK